jgi:hypothetical protein
MSSLHNDQAPVALGRTESGGSHLSGISTHLSGVSASLLSTSKSYEGFAKLISGAVDVARGGILESIPEAIGE